MGGTGFFWIAGYFSVAVINAMTTPIKEFNLASIKFQRDKCLSWQRNKLASGGNGGRSQKPRAHLNHRQGVERANWKWGDVVE